MAAYAPEAGRYRPDGCPDWVDELDLTPSAQHVRMGTRSLKPGRWLAADGLAPGEIALRRRLLAEQRRHVFGCMPEAEDATAETAQLVAAQCGGAGDDQAGSHPLARAGSSIQEDLCLMVHHHGDWHLNGAVLCFPSRWNLAEKMGRPTAQVHQPVAHYAEELGDRVDTFFDRLAPAKPVWRRNLSLWPTCLLWVPAPHLDPLLWDAPSGDPATPNLWLRSEYQTLHRLPVSGAILFTIRVQMAPLSVLAHRPDRAADLAEWLRAPSGESRRTELGPRLDHDLVWLEKVAAGA
jgi:hypothetical protein